MQNINKNMDDILEESYSLIGQHLNSKYEIWFSSETIKTINAILCKYSSFSIDDIHHILFQKFMELEKHKLFDPERASLFTYTCRFVFEHTRALKKTLDETYNGCKFVTLDDFFLEEFLWKNKSVKLRQENISDDGWLMLPHKSQEDALNRLVEYTTPEDLLIRKEFMEAANDHYDEIDIMVLSGLKGRNSAADELSIKDDAYGKRLQRKNAAFRVIYSQPGHC